MEYFFIKGIFFGFLIAAPVGPVGVLCIRRTINDGRLHGFLSGLGAATADSLYGLVAVFGMSALYSLLVDWQDLIRLIGGVFLLYLGYQSYASTPNPDRRSKTAKSYLSAYITTLGLTLTNPMTILSFAAVFTGFSLVVTLKEFTPGFLLVTGVFLGSTTWWLFLSMTAGFIRERLNVVHLKWVNRLSGFLIACFGLLILVNPTITPKEQIVATVDTQPAQISTVNSSGFSRAEPGHELRFPTDQGPHPDYQTEWWYYTGNVQDENGRRFGYQLTIFRRSLLPPQQVHIRPSAWSTTQVYLGHFALTDVAESEHYEFEELHRGAAGIAGSRASPFSVWLLDWQVYETGGNQYHLEAGDQAEDGKTIQINLDLTNLKELVYHGDRGYSRKGPDRGNASYYYSMTRLKTSGEIRINNDVYPVQGYSWMDHEYSTSALTEDQVGWDWFSIQMEDGSELMVFQIRKKDGSVDPFSSGTWVSPDGNVVRLEQDDFTIEVATHWVSKSSGGIYPSRWKIYVPRMNVSIELAPLLDDQEMDLTYTYWEGAVRVQGTRENIPISGFGYVELTGYAGTIAGEF